MKYCQNCGAQIADKAVICVNCGVATAEFHQNQAAQGNISDKSGVVTLIICIFLGYLGIHRFFVGKTGTGIIMLLTLGGFGIWTLIDLIVIVMGNFTDSQGKVIKL